MRGLLCSTRMVQVKELHTQVCQVNISLLWVFGLPQQSILDRGRLPIQHQVVTKRFALRTCLRLPLVRLLRLRRVNTLILFCTQVQAQVLVLLVLDFNLIGFGLKAEVVQQAMGFTMLCVVCKSNLLAIQLPQKQQKQLALLHLALMGLLRVLWHNSILLPQPMSHGTGKPMVQAHPTQQGQSLQQ